ncbi:MAG TPA: hypothetical protein DCS82_04140 [Rhodospirillaceae bacterium]|nr:hypothetical protein [Rhodospirillaceae bacterium]
MAERAAWLDQETKRNALILRACGAWSVRHVAELARELEAFDRALFNNADTDYQRTICCLHC